jgi:SAM-dependent methyltransferase
MRIDYDRISGRYDRSRSFGPEFGRELAEVLPAGFAPRGLLEVGCGTGNATACLAAAWPGAHLVGLDLSAGMLARARAKLGALPLVRADACRLPFAARSFDLVAGVYVLHHLKSPEDFYAEAARALRPGGRLVLLTAAHAQIQAHFLGEFFPSFAEVDCARFPDLPEVEMGLAAAGLRPAGRREVDVAEYAVDDSYLARVRERHISTLELVPEAEFAAGLERLTAWVRERTASGLAPMRHAARGTLVAAARK